MKEKEIIKKKMVWECEYCHGSDDEKDVIRKCEAFHKWMEELAIGQQLQSEEYQPAPDGGGFINWRDAVVISKDVVKKLILVEYSNGAREVITDYHGHLRLPKG